MDIRRPLPKFRLADVGVYRQRVGRRLTFVSFNLDPRNLHDATARGRYQHRTTAVIRLEVRHLHCLLHQNGTARTASVRAGLKRDKRTRPALHRLVSPSQRRNRLETLEKNPLPAPARLQLAPQRAQDGLPRRKVVGRPRAPADLPVLLCEFRRVAQRGEVPLRGRPADRLQRRHVDAVAEALDEHLGGRRRDDVVEGLQVRAGRDGKAWEGRLGQDGAVVKLGLVQGLEGDAGEGAVQQKRVMERRGPAKAGIRGQRDEGRNRVKEGSILWEQRWVKIKATVLCASEQPGRDE